MLKLNEIKKRFTQDDNSARYVLDAVTLAIETGEIVALLGCSGSGKSTLLRIISGLLTADSGEVIYQNRIVSKPTSGISMVFQQGVLMPWLTVLKNVELPLEALRIPQKERRKMALQAIDMVGLDGFESAFPRELSGGMQQRVGLARALVVDPELLLMDEPFSALDVLTAENLRNDLLSLWHAKKNRVKAILFVTHDIEEAVLMANRIIILGGTPSHIIKNLKVNFDYPRLADSIKFRNFVNQVYQSMTRRVGDLTITPIDKIDKFYRLPEAKVSELIGLIETLLELSENNKRYSIQLEELNEILHYDVDELFPLVEVLELLKFIEPLPTGLQLSKAGRVFASADLWERKQLFSNHLLSYIPLAQHIYLVLSKSSQDKETAINKEYFIHELSEHLSLEESNRILRLIIEWGRYGELFAYDDNAETLSLENPQ